MTDRSFDGRPRVTATGSVGGGSTEMPGRPARLPLRARIAWRLGVEGLSRMRVGHLVVVLPDGSRRAFGDPGSPDHGEIRLHHPDAMVRMLVGGETGAGEAYMDGLWSSPDLPALLRVAALNRGALALSSGWWRLPAQLRRTWSHRRRRNTASGARRNIAAHYDLGNAFYRLFLDETMTYSSAVFAAPEQDLADAQRNKYRRMAERAGLRAGDHVLEIGTGWGGFALYAAGDLGCRITTITISPAQHAVATERVHAAGLGALVDVRLLDYRDVTGRYDAVVSIEMLEAVGHEYFATFFEKVDVALKPGGRASIQVITFPDAAYEAQRRGANWIQTHIFPGGLCPSLEVLERSIAPTGLRITDVDDIGPHYVRTLDAWRARFLDRLDDVRAQGFDERFIRMWDYYLALCSAGFATGVSQDLQLVFEKTRGSG